MQEGPRMMGHVDGQPHDSIRIGLRVKARVGRGVGGGLCVVFDADGDAEAGAGP
jgi:hypothetical protein